MAIRQRVNALTRELAPARSGDPRAIHQARVATRRLREALPLLANGARRRKLEKTVRRLTRALGPVRELDVALDMLGELEGADDVPQAGLACLRQLVSEERRRLHVEAAGRLERCDADRLRRRASAAVRRSRSAGRQSRPTARDAWSRAGRRADRLRRAIDNAGGMYLPDRLHDVRIAVKKLRYALEIAQQVGAPAAAGRPARRTTGRLAVLRRVQDTLGRMHDFEVLIARTRGVQGSAGAPSLQLSGDLDRLVRRFETECRLLHAHYMTSRPRLTEVCDAVSAVAGRVSRRATAA